MKTALPRVPRKMVTSVLMPGGERVSQRVSWGIPEPYSTFSSSMAFLAFARSSSAIRETSSGSSENLRFSPVFAPFPCPFFQSSLEGSRAAGVSVLGVSVLGLRLLAPTPLLILSPACVSSNSRIARSWASESRRALSSWTSRSSCSRAFSARLISFFWARMLLRTHSRQKMSPWRHATGSMAGSRHSQHEAKGRNESRERRAVDEPQAARAIARSWDVKMGRVVFLLPGRSDWHVPGSRWACRRLTVCHCGRKGCG